jgi:phage baseplate assembly protein V
MMDLIAQLMRRLKLIASRGVLTATDDTSAVQMTQGELLAGELRSMARPQDYGFTCVPLPGAQLISLSLSGQRQQSIVIRAEDGRYRKTNLQPGEVCLYTDEGDLIRFKRGSQIAIQSDNEIDITATNKVSVTAPVIEATGATSVTLTSGASSLALTPVSAILKAAAITLDGTVTCSSTLAVAAGLSAGGGAVTADASGVTAPEMTVDGTGLKAHTHGGVTTGIGSTGAPQ